MIREDRNLLDNCTDNRRLNDRYPVSLTEKPFPKEVCTSTVDATGGTLPEVMRSSLGYL